LSRLRRAGVRRREFRHQARLSVHVIGRCRASRLLHATAIAVIAELYGAAIDLRDPSFGVIAVRMHAVIRDVAGGVISELDSQSNCSLSLFPSLGIFVSGRFPRCKGLSDSQFGFGQLTGETRIPQGGQKLVTFRPFIHSLQVN
jgi:hypothetical protein